MHVTHKTALAMQIFPPELAFPMLLSCPPSALKIAQLVCKAWLVAVEKIERDRFCELLLAHVDQDDKQTVINYQKAPSENWLHKIVVLNLSSCDLKHLPSDIKLLQHLIKLELVNNSLKDLPEWFCTLRKLRILNLQGNLFDKVPNILSKMPWITQLYLYHNPLCELPMFLDEKALKSYPLHAHWVD